MQKILQTPGGPKIELLEPLSVEHHLEISTKRGEGGNEIAVKTEDILSTIKELQSLVSG